LQGSENNSFINPVKKFWSERTLKYFVYLIGHCFGIINKLGLTTKIKDQVLKLAALSEKAGVDGIVCSGHEVEYLKKEFADRFKYIVPGIRIGDKKHDHKRNITPAEAFENGADYIVIGRSITESHKPEVVAELILDSLK